MDASDSLVGVALAVKLGSEEPATLFELGVELLGIAGGQFVNWVLPRAGVICW